MSWNIYENKFVSNLSNECKKKRNLKSKVEDFSKTNYKKQLIFCQIFKRCLKKHFCGLRICIMRMLAKYWLVASCHPLFIFARVSTSAISIYLKVIIQLFVFLYYFAVRLFTSRNKYQRDNWMCAWIWKSMYFAVTFEKQAKLNYRRENLWYKSRTFRLKQSSGLLGFLLKTLTQFLWKILLNF